MRNAKILRLFGLIVSLFLLLEATSWGQQGGAYGRVGSGMVDTALPWSQVRQASHKTAQSNPALRYFSGKNVLPTPQSTVRAQRPMPSPVQVTARNKPFSQAQRTSTISPYLNLEVRQSDEGIPNYYAFVLPLLRQQATNQTQRRQFGHMEQQLRSASAHGIVANNPNGGMPTTGHSTQFLNMANYYPGGSGAAGAKK
jgi:hypothetical protein